MNDAAEKRMEFLEIKNPKTWCICRPDDQDKALCGRPLEGSGVPDCEVPDEFTCPECLNVLDVLRKSK